MLKIIIIILSGLFLAIPFGMMAEIIRNPPHLTYKTALPR